MLLKFEFTWFFKASILKVNTDLKSWASKYKRSFLKFFIYAKCRTFIFFKLLLCSCKVINKLRIRVKMENNNNAIIV